MLSEMLGNSWTPVGPALAFTATVAVTSLLYYLLVLRKRKNFESVCTVKKLFIYPIKAVKGIEVDRLEITADVVKYGIFRDRSWVILDGDNRFVGLKHEPRLALTRSSFHGKELWVDAPDMATLKLSYVEQLDERCNVIQFRMYGQEIKGIDCGQEVHQWFQTFLGKPGIRLLQYHDSFKLRDTNSDKRRTDDNKFPIIYQNKSGLHLVNEHSIKDLNERFPEGEEGVVYDNFRPNLLVEHPKPWDEDMWQYMRINGVLFLRLLRCDRCPSTQVNQSKGVAGQPTLATLKKFRPPQGETKRKGLGPSFGVIYGPLSTGFINVNDQIEVVYGENEIN